MIRIEIPPGEIDKIKRQFNRLSIDAQDKVLRQVMRRQAKPVMDRMKSLVPVSETGGVSQKYTSRQHAPGYLKKTIGIVVSRKGKPPIVWIGPRFTRKFDPWYAHLPQMVHKVGRGGKTTKRTEFVTDAWNQTKAQVMAGVLKDTERMLQEQINKL